MKDDSAISRPIRVTGTLVQQKMRCRAQGYGFRDGCVVFIGALLI